MMSIRVIFLLYVSFLCHDIPVSSKLCRSIRIRNKVSNLEKLRNCTQILGSLQIALMDLVEDEREFDDYVFPELTHITGYLMFFAVHKLKSIGQLFPNLKAIRGAELFADYALVIHQMPDLKEIGITNLLFIGRGYVKVDKCPLLCYVDTVNWEKLGDNVKLHYSVSIESDTEEKEMEKEVCKPCPAECGGYCWNAMHCQDLEADKCHEECLGCYEEQSPMDCIVCKNYQYNNVCVPECPSHMYNHTISNKCVTEEQCRSNMNNTLKGSWWPFGRECVNGCPGNYQNATDKDGKVICVFCGTNCTKYCNVTEEVSDMDKMQKLKGCTHIEGSLAIRLFNIDPRKIIGDLSEYLGSIRYIKNSLIIGRSKGITTLAVLKNLRMIEGNHSDNKYALFVYDNPNLQHLWNFSDPSFKLEIKNGTVVFHDNPLLCVSEILQLGNVTGMNYTEADVSMYSNGDKAACNKTDVDVNVTNNEVNISWKEKPCNGLCIGYTLFYRIVEMNETVTIFYSKDVCIDNVWNSIFTSKTSVVLRELKAYTRYAFYIKTYHGNSRQVSQSDIKYFVTKPDTPGSPRDVKAHAINSHTITVKWKRPVDVNGNLGKYAVNIDEEEDQTDLSILRNYCENPWSPDGTIIDMDSQLFQTNAVEAELAKIASQSKSDTEGSSGCSCKNEEEPVVEYFKIFNRDVTLHNCDDHAMSKFGYDECRNYKYKVVKSIQKRSENISLDRAIYIEPNVTTYNITSLKHFTMYVFYLAACNEINGKYSCSGVEQTFERTVRKEDADDVHDVEVHIQDSNVHITWSEPKNPNSMILAYKIIYNETSTENSAPITTCIPRDDKFNSSSWVLNYLSPGTYLIKVQAVSLAGPGRESEEISFVIAEPRKLTTTLILWVCITLVAIFLVGVIVYFWWKRKHPPITFRDINPEYHGLQYEPDDWEIERSDIELYLNLGRGTFGTVYYGKIKSKNIIVAVKTANENKDRMEFLNEASVMKSFSNCHHVVRLYGVVSIGEPPLVIMELMKRGDLKKYLHRTRESSHSLTSPEIYRMAVEIADGMAYLAAKKFVHRDLAARNCMVASDRTVKIGDFGMARDIYETDYYKKGTKGLLPVRWMAPESLADGVFTSNSDVWSYGIVLWEISTLAEQPYQGMSNEQVLQFVVSQGRLERPQECSDLLYEVMRRCWRWRPMDRPTFWDIVEKLEDHVDKNFKVVSFIHSREGNEHKIIHGRSRVQNAPAICTEQEEDLMGHYNVSDDEVSLHVGTAPKRPSLSQVETAGFRPAIFTKGEDAD